MKLPRPWWPLSVVIGMPLLLGAPLIMGQQVLYWGTPLLQFYPWRELAGSLIRAGQWPLWNSWVGNGAPLLANYQSAVFYPLNWLAALIPLDQALGVGMVLHWIWAGLGMVWLARRLGLPALAQTVAGLAFGLSQCLVARAGFLSINAAIAWLPWIIGAGEALYEKPSLVTLIGLALALGLQWLAGHAQTAWYSLLLLGAWLVWRAARRPAARAWARGGWVAAAGVLAGGLAAIQLLPTAELLRQSPRAVAAGYEFVMTYSLSPWRLLTLLAPDALGNPARGTFYGYGNYWEDNLYIGLLPVIGAVGALLVAVRLRRPRGTWAELSLFLTGVAGVTLLLALGRNTPVFPWLYAWVPTFNLFQAPARWLMVTTFALALLAGVGISGWQAPSSRAIYWLNLGLAGAAMMVITAGVVWLVATPQTMMGTQLRTVAGAAGECGLNALGVCGLARFWPRQPGRRWDWLVTAWVALDLGLAGYGLNPGASPMVYRSPATTTSALASELQGHRLFYYPADEYTTKFDFFSFKTFGSPDRAQAVRDAQVPNAAMISGLTSANNFDPLVSARYAGLLEVVSTTHSLALLRLMDVGVVASRTPLPWIRVAQVPGVNFYRVPAAPQRVWTVTAARLVAGSEAALQELERPDFDPAAVVILEANAPGTRPRADRPPPATAFPRTTLTVDLPQAGWVVLAETYYPGWAVYVDGQPAALRPGDYAFQAVAVPAGPHTLIFDYQPLSFLLGGGLTLGAAGVVFGLLAWLIFRTWRHG